jgi:hypothetical protein
VCDLTRVVALRADLEARVASGVGCRLWGEAEKQLERVWWATILMFPSSAAQSRAWRAVRRARLFGGVCPEHLRTIQDD